MILIWLIPFLSPKQKKTCNQLLNKIETTYSLPGTEQTVPSNVSVSLVSSPCSDLLSAYQSKTWGELVLVALSQTEPCPVLHSTCWLNATDWRSTKKTAAEQWKKVEDKSNDQPLDWSCAFQYDASIPWWWHWLRLMQLHVLSRWWFIAYHIMHCKKKNKS